MPKIFKSDTLDRGSTGGLVHLSHAGKKVLSFVPQAEIPALAEQMLLPQLCALGHCPNIDVLSLGSLLSPCVCTGESISELPGEIPAWCELVYTTHDLFSSPDHAA